DPAAHHGHGVAVRTQLTPRDHVRPSEEDMKRNRSPRRRHGLALRAAHRGLTLLEIMIVIAILGLVMGLVVVPRVMDMFADSQEKIAKLAVNQLAGKDYAQWSMATNKTCPE